MSQNQVDFENQNPARKVVIVIGGGVVGKITAIQLQSEGHEVIIIDADKKSSDNNQNFDTGSKASLGILMGYVSRKSSGRSWKLKKRSMELWPQLIDNLNKLENQLTLKNPLVKLASSEKESKLFDNLIKERSHLGLENYEIYKAKNKTLNLPDNKYGGLVSHKDGRIDPLILLESLTKSINNSKIKVINQEVIKIKKHKEKWEIVLKDQNKISTDFVVICSAIGSEILLKPLGYEISLEPILGQAIELRLEDKAIDLKSWPAVISFNGINLVPLEKGKYILGATLEKGKHPNNFYLNELKAKSFPWVKRSTIERQWSGIRARPINQPSPILTKLESGLIVNTAHYRNGILLAPACAEWVAIEIKNSF